LTGFASPAQWYPGRSDDVLGQVKEHLNIAVDLTPMLPGGENGGVKFVILEFLRGLKRFFGERLTFLFLTANDSHGEVTSLLGDRDTAISVLTRRRAGLGTALQALELGTRSKLTIRKLFQERRVDLFYCPFGFLFFPSANTPTVVMVVDLLHRDFPFSIPAQTREWRELQFRKLAGYVDFYQVISDFTAERLQTVYQVPSQQIFKTSLPIQHRLSVAKNKEPRKPFFLYPSNFWVHKNHEILLIAYQIYLSKVIDRAWDLVLTGYLDERARALQRVAEDLGVSSRVKFLGHVPEAELGELYSNASCLVFPSLYEGFGIPIVEAMSFGIPIICGREASIPEIAGEAAFYMDARNPVEVASALQRITEDENLRKTLVDRGTMQLRKFDFYGEVNRLAEAFALAAEKNRRSQRNRLEMFLTNLRLGGIYYGRAIARKALEGAVSLPLNVERMARSLSDLQQ